MTIRHARPRCPARHGSSRPRVDRDANTGDPLCCSIRCRFGFCSRAGFPTREMVIEYTPDWKGERFADGRPKVPDNILKRMRTVTLEEAWAILREAGFNHEYEDGWFEIHPEQVMVGRALTAQWLPGRPDIHAVIEA